MPYKDKDRQREYQREYQRGKRQGLTPKPAIRELPSEFRLRTAEDLVELVQEQIDAVRHDPAARAIEKARCIALLIGVALRTLEQRDLTSRLEAIEAILNQPERDVKAA
jgi:hypothetical protein